MRLTQIVTAILALAFAPIAGFAAGGSTPVRAIAFVASNDRGATDARLAPYESVLRANLRFESFKYVGESSISVSPGSRASLAIPGGGSVQLEADASGNVRVNRAGTVVPIAPGRPAVFLGGEAKGGASGIIVMTN